MSLGYKLVCEHDKFSRPFKTYFSKDAVYNFINNMMKKHFNEELVMTKEDNEDFKNSTKCWIYDNVYVDNDVMVRDHCRISGKYRGCAHRDFNINLKLNRKIPVVSRNL